MNSFRNFILLFFACLAASTQASAQQNAQSSFRLQEGDLLFQDLDCGPLCDAIEKVTMGHKGHTFSHVGIVVFRQQEPFVLEAIGDSVQLTPLPAFMKRTSDAAGAPKVAVGRMKPKYRGIIPEAITQAFTYRGKPYDGHFLFSNDAYYCSELVYLTYIQQAKPLFAPAPMTYKDPQTKQLFSPWETYFRKINAQIPEGEPGVNPGAMSRAAVLKMYYPYGKPDRLRL